ncbi:MAG TPA: hypothetical protein VFM45_00275 [Anaeromyxobacteraceae bacterium]|nr:hypothetical protein [Anaeromyxobacteraceae bacterium]
MGTPPSRRAPPTEPVSAPGRRPLRWIAAGVAALALAGAWMFLRDGADGPEVGSAPPASTASLPPRPPTPSEISDPEEARRAADLEERRGRYATLRSSFGTGAPPSPRSLARLSAVLEPLWPRDAPAWTAACNGQLCRVDAPGPAGAWHDRLASDRAVAALADRVVVDPDGAESAAYLVLATAGATHGGSVLDAVEEEFRTSTEIRECLSRVGAIGSIEYAVTVDGSGYSYLQRTDLPGEAADCADRVLGEILDRNPPPRSVRAASRTLALRR